MSEQQERPYRWWRDDVDIVYGGRLLVGVLLVAGFLILLGEALS